VPGAGVNTAICPMLLYGYRFNSTISSPSSTAAPRPWGTWHGRCLPCNKRKGPNFAGLDSKTRKLVPLFHPRRHKWARHFRRDGPYLRGRTAIGRATIIVLGINEPFAVEVRRNLIKEGQFPTDE
jgi:hypothetical protein